jgi:peptide/nickel transport system permease protein
MTARKSALKSVGNSPRLGGLRHIGIDVWISCIVVAAAIFWTIFPQLGGAGALAHNISEGALPAFSDGHVFGTDEYGRDILKLTIAGTRSALIGPIVIATGSIVIGLLFGALAGWFGGVVDWIISRYADLTLSMPSLLLAIVVAGIIGGGYWVSVLVMIILYSPFDIRLVRSAVIAERSKPYIEAALVLKLRTVRILVRHIFPNVALIVLVNFFLNIGYAIVSMSSLSYLGLGVSPQDADWGRQLLDARGLIFNNTAAILVPGIAIIVTATAVNILGNYIAEKNTIAAV